MPAWLESIAGSAYATAILWTFGALLLLVVILLAIKVIRSLSFGTFVSGGRNRKTRLAVMDAAAVDSHRRLVLVRRDDVEHLILIGGPTDVVVEQNIRLVASMRRPIDEPAQQMPRGEVRLPPDAQLMTPTQPAAPVAAPAPEREEFAQPVSAPAPVEQPRPAVASAPAPRPVSPAPAALRPMQPLTPPAPRPMQPLTPVPPRAPATPPAPVVARPPVAPTPLRPATPPPAPAPAQRPAPPKAVNDQPPSLDDALLEELEVTLDRNAATEPKSAGLPASVEDEMEKLLGDLARPRR